LSSADRTLQNFSKFLSVKPSPLSIIVIFNVLWSVNLSIIMAISILVAPASIALAIAS